MDKKKTVNIDMKQYGMVLALIAVFLIFAVMTGGKNMSPANINNLIMQNGYVVILAVGMLLCCLTGNIDLGVGSIVALCGATVGILMIDYHTNMWVAILAALAVGALAGMFVGLFVSKLSIPPLPDGAKCMTVASQQTSFLYPFQNMGSQISDFILWILLYKFLQDSKELIGFSSL